MAAIRSLLLSGLLLAGAPSGLAVRHGARAAFSALAGRRGRAPTGDVATAVSAATHAELLSRLFEPDEDDEGESLPDWSKQSISEVTDAFLRVAQNIFKVFDDTPVGTRITKEMLLDAARNSRHPEFTEFARGTFADADQKGQGFLDLQGAQEFLDMLKAQAAIMVFGEAGDFNDDDGTVTKVLTLLEEPPADGIAKKQLVDLVPAEGHEELLALLNEVFDAVDAGKAGILKGEAVSVFASKFEDALFDSGYDETMGMGDDSDDDDDGSS